MLPADMVTAVGGAAAGVGAAIQADLQRAAAVAGMGGTFEVDLDVLYGYYGKMTDLYTLINQHIASFEANAYPGDMQCGGAGGSIAGAQAAAEATSASVGPDGMVGALYFIRQQVGKHLADLKTNYDAYIKADDDNAQILTAAAHPELANGNGTADVAGKNPASSLGW